MLSDAGWGVFDTFWTQNTTPAAMLLAPGMQVVKDDWVFPSDIEGVLPD